jgi:hypothetical protein
VVDEEAPAGADVAVPDPVVVSGADEDDTPDVVVDDVAVS